MEPVVIAFDWPSELLLLLSLLLLLLELELDEPALAPVGAALA